MFTVFGATGNTGAVVAERLIAAGKPVRVAVRDASKVRVRGAEIVTGDLSDAAFVTRALTGADQCAKQDLILSKDLPGTTVWKDLSIDTAQFTLTQNLTPTLNMQLAAFDQPRQQCPTDPLALAIRRDIDRIRLAIELAQEAGLAVLHTRENRQAGLPGINHVGRTDFDACPAIGTAVRDDELDHDTASS